MVCMLWTSFHTGLYHEFHAPCVYIKVRIIIFGFNIHNVRPTYRNNEGHQFGSCMPLILQFAVSFVGQVTHLGTSSKLNPKPIQTPSTIFNLNQT
jgi:hypothetical protein